MYCMYLAYRFSKVDTMAGEMRDNSLASNILEPFVAGVEGRCVGSR